MQHRLIVLSRNACRDVCVTYVTLDGYRNHHRFSTDGRSVTEAREQAIQHCADVMDADGRAFVAINVLSIEAWRDGDGWTWNSWHKLGTLTLREFGPLGARTRQEIRRTLRWFRDNGYLSDASKGIVTLEDDGRNLTVLDRSSREPLIAIEYGTAYP